MKPSTLKTAGKQGIRASAFGAQMDYRWDEPQQKQQQLEDTIIVF